MSYDSAATRARLLDAACDEFVKVGLAGGRVDRIAAAASANKQAIYQYFGSKEALFEAVMADRLRILADEAPLTADNLPGYAGALFDALVADPGLQRLNQWRTLEFPDASEGEIETHVSKAAEIAEQYGVSLNAATDVMMIALAAALAWNSTAARIRNPLGDEPTHRLAEYRRAVVTAVAAVTDALLRSNASAQRVE
ncbi:TetR/AcrR family transcriptional regulator [Kibdelosporangium aridum]|uniref:Transcriptional regulator, TetR family n=1 Tax=Kibdelosporangium aridum TaxID=2030 RepID=A0A1W2FWK2_KIBAR|nr:TetR family transcriptional regulator [Kibdelosporangium aridum]SMD26357.1 transcriptional regulator, TetR family [Kibdelosporangium aridum]